MGVDGQGPAVKRGPVGEPGGEYAQEDCEGRGVCYSQHMRAPGMPDPNDPLAPRPDDPIGYQRGWWRRLYDRPQPGASALRYPLIVTAMLLLVGGVALAVVMLGQG